jgi:hypothetical protein
VKYATYFLLLSNVFLFVLLVYSSFTATTFDTSVPLLGGLIAATFFVMYFFSDVNILIRTAGTSMLLIVAQITNTFVPNVLSTRTGMSMDVANAIALLFPVFGLLLIEAMVFNAVTRQLFISGVLSFLVVLNVSLLEISWYEDICCDTEGVCALWFNQTHLVFLLMLTGLMVVRLMHISLTVAVQWCRNGCCFSCCKNRCRRRCCCCLSRQSDKSPHTYHHVPTTEGGEVQVDIESDECTDNDENGVKPDTKKEETCSDMNKNQLITPTNVVHKHILISKKKMSR